MPTMADTIISSLDATLAIFGLMLWAMRVTEPDVATEAEQELSYPAPEDDDDGNPPSSAVVSEAHS